MERVQLRGNRDDHHQSWEVRGLGQGRRTQCVPVVGRAEFLVMGLVWGFLRGLELCLSEECDCGLDQGSVCGKGQGSVCGLAGLGTNL